MKTEEELAAEVAEAERLANEEAENLEESEEVLGDDAEDKEVPLFMQESEPEDPDKDDSVPLGAHVKAKDKLKGKIGERDDEIEKLRKENEQLKLNTEQKPEVKLVKRPRLNDFDTDDEYEDAMDEWEKDSSKNVFNTYEQDQTAKAQANQQVADIKKSVDAHYDRAQVLVTEHSISPEVYKQADAEVRAAVAAVHENADVVTDAFIQALGEGSEKALFYIGRNKNALNEFKAILNSDKSGLKVAAFLGEIKGRVSNTTKQKSRATPPGTQINGESATPKGSAEKRKYDKAHKSKSGQEAYNIKKAAKKAGVDVSTW